MQTDADKKIDSAKEKLLSAWRDLQDVLDPETDGHMDFKTSLALIQNTSGRLYELYRVLDQAGRP